VIISDNEIRIKQLYKEIEMAEKNLNIAPELNVLLDDIAARALTINERGIEFPIPYKRKPDHGFGLEAFFKKMIEFVLMLVYKKSKK